MTWYKVVPTGKGCDAFGPDSCMLCGRLTDERKIAEEFKWSHHTLQPVSDDEAVAWQLAHKPMLEHWITKVRKRSQMGAYGR